MHKAFKACTAVLLALVMTVSLVNGALAAVVRNDDDTISYEPLEQGVYSKGGYTIDKVSHPTLGAGEVDGILTGDLQDRGQSYSWSMAEAGDYVYIGTCYNSTYYIYHNNVKTSLDAMKKAGKLDQNVDTSRAAADFVKVMFGTDTFDETPMSQWTPVIMAVNRYTGEAQVIFRERDILKDYPDIFPGYPPYLKGVNYLAGYRMAFEFKGKIYFAGMGNPTATLIEVDPETNECSIAYHNINYTQGVSNGVHGLLVFDDEIYMCLASDNYDGKGTPGGIIVASSDPTAGLSSWRRVADQDDFDGLPAVMKTDGLNGGGIWDIIEYNGSMYVTVVTDKSIDGHINKQGFAMYRGDKHEDGSFTWTQVIGDHGTSGYGFGLGINYSMSCNMWVYNGYLYLGTYNDPMLDLAEVPASGNFELLYNDLDHSIYLYRMDADGNFQQVAGKDDNPYFPDGPIGNLGAGLGNNSNQYVWRYGEHNGELYIGTYDTSTLTYQFTQITDGQVANMDYADISGRADMLKDADYAVINSNYAINAGLNPVKDSLAIEGSSSAYANILAVKEGNENSPKILALKAALESRQVASFIESKYNGSVVSTVTNPGNGYDDSVDYDALKGQTITVAASPTPHAEILEVAKEILAAKDITLDIQVYNDYVVPNTVVDDGTLDANYFQHLPYLEDFNAENNTHIVSVSAIHVEPMGLYGGRQTSLDALKASK